MRNRGWIFRVIGVLALLSGAFAGHTAEMTKLTVSIKNESGKPVDRAGVIVRFVQGRNYIKLGRKIRTTYELRTNQEGEASIPEIPQGTIRVQIIAKGYQTFGQDFEVTEPEKTIEIKLNPPQAQYSAHQP